MATDEVGGTGGVGPRLIAVTPAVKLLEKRRVGHRVLTYDHEPDGTAYGDEAVEALGLDAASVFKTLVATVDGAHVVAVVPVADKLDLKALARAAKGKKAAMADAGDAERLTGYVVGGISPLGQRKRLPTFIDTSAQTQEHIHVSAGKRGVEIAVAPADLASLANATFAPIAS
ncbi:MAG: Cys-tRNA(Pro) deacylase [Actinomycetota bacterium]